LESLSLIEGLPLVALSTSPPSIGGAADVPVDPFLVPNPFDLLHSANYYLLVEGYLRRYSCSPCGGAFPPENILRALPANAVYSLRGISGKFFSILILVFRPISVGRIIVSFALILFF
jgi:hypothetical protein